VLPFLLLPYTKHRNGETLPQRSLKADFFSKGEEKHRRGEAKKGLSFRGGKKEEGTSTRNAACFPPLADPPQKGGGRKGVGCSKQERLFEDWLDKIEEKKDFRNGARG